MPSVGSRIVAYLFLGVVCSAGPIMLLIATATGIERALFIHSSLPADGVIVALRQPPSRRHTNQSRSPIFRFMASNGQSYTVTSYIAQRPSPWRFGDHVPVLYQPGHPENASIDSFVQLWEPQVVLSIVGASFSSVPFLIFRARRRANASPARVR